MTARFVICDSWKKWPAVEGGFLPLQTLGMTSVLITGKRQDAMVEVLRDANYASLRMTGV
jgi:hypothetical protein